MIKDSMEEMVSRISSRFVGFSLEFRRSGTHWPSQWRARLLVAKNERSSYRLQCFGDTAKDAVKKLIDEIGSVDMSQ